MVISNVTISGFTKGIWGGDAATSGYTRDFNICVFRNRIGDDFANNHRIINYENSDFSQLI